MVSMEKFVVAPQPVTLPSSSMESQKISNMVASVSFFRLIFMYLYVSASSPTPSYT